MHELDKSKFIRRKIRCKISHRLETPYRNSCVWPGVSLVLPSETDVIKLDLQLFSYAILGFALSEAMGLFCLMMAFLLLFAF
jgi:hypothetical protein